MDLVLPMAIALGLEPVVVHGRQELRERWGPSRLRLVGVDVVDRIPAPGPWPGTWVLGRGEQELLRASSRIGAPVISLPDGMDDLAGILAASAGVSAGGSLWCVVGATGGLGVSSLVVALATAAAGSGTTSVAVELREFGGGLDLLFGLETAPGPRWDQFRDARGHLRVEHKDLISRAGAAVLSLDREEPALPGASEVGAVVGALTRSHDAVFLDGDPFDRGVTDVSGTVLVVGADVVSVSAARMWLRRWESREVSLVVRGAPGRSLPSQQVADALGLELAGSLRHDRIVPRLAEVGECVASARARSLNRDVRRLWKALKS